MKNFNLFYSNKIEVLLESLAGSLKKPGPGVFEPEIIVVQSKGMEKYLSLNLSRYLGISANNLFLYPNSMLEYCFEKTGLKKNESVNYSSELNTWAIMELIYEFRNKDIFAEVLNYIKLSNDSISIEKLYQFSSKVSRLFLEYQIFRPDWILLWEENENYNGWQSFLWNRLSEKTNQNSVVSQFDNLIKQYSENKELLNNLSGRISVFGIFSLPRIYTDALNFFSNMCEVNLYLLNPCREYWGEILSEKKIQKIRRKTRQKDLYLESGNSLLASLGETGKVFFDLINDYEINKIDEKFVPGEQNTLLSGIQLSILNLFDYSDKEKKKVSINDNSIRIHSCHGIMREMEVLKDNILYILDTDEDIKLSDIIVMIPDIEKYSFYVKAVFDRKDDKVKIPFSIADRALKTENKGLDSFFKLLKIFTTRFEASSVLDLLEDSLIYQKFGLNEAGVEKIKDWVFKLKISWGLDPQFKKRFDLFPEDLGTWEKGLDSISLGHALNPDDFVFFDSVFPLFELETSDQETASGLIEFYIKIKKYSEIITGGKYCVAEWADIFLSLCDDFLYFEKQAEFDFINLKKTLTDLKEEAFYSHSEIKVPFAVMCQRIEKIVSAPSSGYGFLDGRITFCAMLPMRSIPFKMICVCGLNESDFPRNYFPPDFDLMAKSKRKGDRHIRDDDRYLFLETIISARKYLYLSYTGKDIKTDTIIPPSPVLSEFTDYIEDNFVSEKNITELIYRNHFASAFSKAYFSCDKPLDADLNQSLFSYSKRYMELSENINLEKKDQFVFSDTDLKTEEDLYKDFNDLNSFVNFFKDPQKFYLKFNSIETGNDFDFFEDREIFNPGNLLNYIISNDLLDMFLSGIDDKICKMVLKSRNLLPYGKTGDIFYDSLKEEILFFVKKIEVYLKEPTKILISLNEKKLKIKGSLSLYSGKILLFRYGKIKPKNILELWIKHNLALNCTNEEFKNFSMFAGSEKKGFMEKKFEYLEQNQEYLKLLGKYFERGSKFPLSFDPELSFKYMETIHKELKGDFSLINDEIREKGLLSAKKEMNSKNSFKNYSLIEKNFRGRDFLNDDFMETTEKILIPMFEKI
jgi:exodeoxyribonuclease V gamma subunit